MWVRERTDGVPCFHRLATEDGQGCRPARRTGRKATRGAAGDKFHCRILIPSHYPWVSLAALGTAQVPPSPLFNDGQRQVSGRWLAPCPPCVFPLSESFGAELLLGD